MSDSWAMDLAREEQVYSSPDPTEVSSLEWHSPVDGYLSLVTHCTPQYGYVEQESSLGLRHSTADDGELFFPFLSFFFFFFFT